ncbi:hypothetical protein K474DRAFT_202496 [Panus rudis PR-1116 ss-1]|nr:hypothetical protein K474DRAFT_202496 [Panus rudis PR-1116 ss-1]
MVRQLRRRTSRPNYAVLHNFGTEEDADGAGPSTHTHPDEDPIESGSDFAPEKEGDDPAVEADDDEIPLEDIHDAENGPDELEQVESISKVSSKPKPKQTKRMSKKAKSEAEGNAPLSTPNMHHRHRPLPLYFRSEKVERLTEPPRLFYPPAITLTNAWGTSMDINSRLGRAWGCNVGPGPLWELIEDRAWYKESFGNEQGDEASRRPKVHQNISLSQFEIITSEQASVYLPRRSDDSLEPSNPVPCSFGPIQQQQRVEVQPLTSLSMSTYFPGSQSHVFNAGAGVWGIDWCPTYANERQAYSHKHYLAVAPLTSQDHNTIIGSRLPRPLPACIQVWSLYATQPSELENTNTERTGSMRCELVLCHDSGSPFEVKWCPLPSHDTPPAEFDPAKPPRKLGILAGAFEDGTVSLYTIPDPNDIVDRVGHDRAQPIFVRMPEPILRLQWEDTTALCLDWGNSDVLAVGCANGYVAVYNVGLALRTSSKAPILPTHYFSIHQSAIRSIAWIRAPVASAKGEQTDKNPTVIVSGGYDGTESVTDIREYAANTLNRTRDIVNSICYSTYCGGPITIDHDNAVKVYSLTPSMLGRGHKLLETDGPVWSVNASDYHPQIAIGVSDGSCLTTNAMRSTRRGGTVPFLLHKIFQLDYSRKTKEYRMLEHFLPKEITDKPSAKRAKKSPPPSGTSSWPSEVGVHRVVWNSVGGLSGCPLLVSATASGLCRVDWLLGRWMRDRIPYNGVEGMRQEGGARVPMDLDDDSD